MMNKKVFNDLHEIALRKTELRYEVREKERRLKNDYEERNVLMDCFFLGFKGMRWLIQKLRES